MEALAVSPDLFKKYIAYSRQYCSPVLTPEAEEILVAQYVATRQKSNNDTVPVTPRNLLSMTRLAYANARLRLSKHVTAADAEAAVDLVLRTLQKVGIDPETGGLDSLVIETGIGKTAHDKVKAIKDIIRALSAQGGGAALVDQVKEEALQRSISDVRVDDILERLRQDGQIAYKDWNRVFLV